jgi:hypothetical protein
MPEDMQSELGTISTDQKKKILGLNAARLYDMAVPEELQVGEPATAAIGSEPVSPA